MAIQKITADVISSDAITTASISDSAITAAKLAGTLDLTGKTITVATASSGDNDTSAASTAFVQQEIASLVDSAPGTLNTLNELAAALGDDANFSTTVTSSIATKLPLAGGTLTGALTTNGVINTGTSHNFAINTPNSVRINIDSNDSATDQVFVIGKNQTGVDASNNVLFKIGEDGKAGIGVGGPNANLHVGSSNATGDATNPALQIGGTSTYRLGMYTSAEGAVIANANGDDGIQFVVKTAGEAMRIDGGTGNVGIGTTSPVNNGTGSQGLTINGTGNYQNLNLQVNGTTQFTIYTNGTSGTFINQVTADPIMFYTSDTERMRIDSGGRVMIGTSSNSGISNNADNLIVGDNTSATEQGITLCSTLASGIRWNDGADAGLIEYVHSDNRMTFYTSGAERMRIDSSGNVGIGEASPDKILHLKSSGATGIVIESTTNAQNLDIDFYNNAGSAQGRIRYAEGAGSFGFAPNVSASDALHILYNGNVGIGTDSPTQKLEVSPDSDIQAIIGRARIGDLGYDDFAGFGHYDTGVQYAILQHNTGQTFINASSGYPINFRINNATKMIINSNGRVGIGTTTTNAGLTVANGDIRATGAAFANDANSISMSQESSGGVITARGPSTATRGSITLSVNKSNGGDAIAGLKIENDGGLFAFGIAYASASSDVNYNASTGEIFVVSSSRRYKSNITDLNIDTSKILSLRPVSYTDNETETNAVGLIAEEVHEEIPQLVNYKEIEGYDEIQPDSVKYSTLSVYLLKVIKEQQTTIDDLKSRIETLEG